MKIRDQSIIDEILDGIEDLKKKGIKATPKPEIPKKDTPEPEIPKYL